MFTNISTVIAAAATAANVALGLLTQVGPCSAFLPGAFSGRGIFGAVLGTVSFARRMCLGGCVCLFSLLLTANLN